MGQKVNPIGFRLSSGGCLDPDYKINSYWQSYWYCNKYDYKNKLKEDLVIRRYISSFISRGQLSKIFIGRNDESINIIISAVKSRLVTAKIEDLKLNLIKLCNKKDNINIKILEEKKPDLTAYVVANIIAKQIEKRVSYKKVIKKAISSSMHAGAKGIKVTCSGRLSGVEIARSESYKEGKIPLHVLRANIDYAIASANTTYGVIGLKIWIYK